MGWWARRVQRQMEARQQRLASLQAMYPDMDPWIVAGLLSNVPGIAAASAGVIAEERERQAREARLRQIIREELAAAK